MKSKNSKGTSAIDCYKKGGKIKGYAAGGSPTYNEKNQTVNKVTAPSSTTTSTSVNKTSQLSKGIGGASAALQLADAAIPKDTDMKYGTNAYFNNMNTANNITDTAANAAMATGNPYAVAAGGILKGQNALANLVDPKDAYGVSKNGAFSQAVGYYLRPQQAVKSILGDFKNGNVSWRTLAKTTPIGGGSIVNDENAREAAKLKQESEQTQNQANYDTQKSIADALVGQNINDAIANRNAGVTNFKPMYNPNPTLQQASLDTPQVSKYTQWFDKKGYAKGGEIKGKGTAKSDSIKAKVEKGSFVVPAENAEKAKAIREELLESPADEKAELEHKGGVDVKLSNGEHLFTKEEADELKNMGIDLYKEFAPNSEDLKGLKDGGLTSEKAKIMLRENRANGQSLSDAQKKYFGWVAGGRKANGGIVGYKEGGEVKGYADGGEADGFDPEAERKRIEAERKAMAKAKSEQEAKRAADKRLSEERGRVAEAKRKQLADQQAYSAELKKKQIELKALQDAYTTMKAQQDASMRSPNNSANYIGSSGKISKEDALNSQQDLLDKISAKQKELNAAKQNYDYSNNGVNYGLGGNGSVTQPSRGGLNYFTPQGTQDNAPAPVGTNTPAPKANPYKAKPTISTATPDVTFDPTAWANRDGEVTPPETTTVDTSKQYGDKSVLPTPAASTPSPTPNTPVVDPNVPNNGTNTANNTQWAQLASNALPYALGAAQTIYGLNQLKKAGPRPIDKLDPDFLAALNKTRDYVTQGDLQAKYGYTPEQLAALNMQNVGLTNAARYNARNIAGNNPAAALGLERAAANDAYGRALQTRIDDTNLKLEKQQLAANRQNAVNAMTWQKQQQNRQLFLDNLNAWNQKQQAFGALANTGVQNVIDQYNADKRLSSYNQMMKDANKTTY